MILIDMHMPDKCENCRMIDYNGGPNCRLMSKPEAYLMLHEEDYCTRRVEACPLVEVQPVVHCPKCEYWDERLIRCNKHKDSMMYGVHDFCSKGKRKGAEDEA